MLWQILSFDELGPHRLYSVLRLRQAVFIVEQDCIYLDTDNRDQQALHMLGTENSHLLAYQRCIPPSSQSPHSMLGRVVVAPDARGRQLGRELVRRGIEHNLSRWPDSDIRISAQAHLQEFYGSEGFIAQGVPYLEDGMPHREMHYPFQR